VQEKKKEEIEAKRSIATAEEERGEILIKWKECGGLQAPAGRKYFRKKTSPKTGRGAEIR